MHLFAYRRGSDKPADPCWWEDMQGDVQSLSPSLSLNHWSPTWNCDTLCGHLFSKQCLIPSPRLQPVNPGPTGRLENKGSADLMRDTRWHRLDVRDLKWCNRNTTTLPFESALLWNWNDQNRCEMAAIVVKIQIRPTPMILHLSRKLNGCFYNQYSIFYDNHFSALALFNAEGRLIKMVLFGNQPLFEPHILIVKTKGERNKSVDFCQYRNSSLEEKGGAVSCLVRVSPAPYWVKGTQKPPGPVPSETKGGKTLVFAKIVCLP